MLKIFAKSGNTSKQNYRKKMVICENANMANISLAEFQSVIPLCNPLPLCEDRICDLFLTSKVWER